MYMLMYEEVVGEDAIEYLLKVGRLMVKKDLGFNTYLLPRLIAVLNLLQKKSSELI